MVVALDYIVNLNKLACTSNATNDRIKSNSRIGLDLFTNNCLESFFFFSLPQDEQSLPCTLDPTNIVDRPCRMHP
jgi:hypothetical protein